jgi:predicted PolB exonuclease-like 3'-5' exonuclease
MKEKVFFLDVETISAFPSYSALREHSPELADQWARRALRFAGAHEERPLPPARVEELYLEKAAICAEFARIVCISVGFIMDTKNAHTLRVKSFTGKEADILQDLFGQLAATPTVGQLAGHNIKGFDIPMICRRATINGLLKDIPGILDPTGRKPWEMDHVHDTMLMWRFGTGDYTALALLCAALGVPSPKADMDGSKVGGAYWQAFGTASAATVIEQIAAYCEQDVLATARVWAVLAGKDYGIAGFS